MISVAVTARRAVLARLMALYRAAIELYPEHRDLFLAMLRLHELENVKLLWRAVMRQSPREEWMEHWRDVESAAGSPALPCPRSTPDSLHDLARFLEHTAYAGLARRVVAEHGGDRAAAELAFDQWGTSMLLRAAHALPAKERLARQLLDSLAASRNAELYGVSDAALSAIIDNVSSAPVPLVIDRALELAPAIDLLLHAEEELRDANRIEEM